jgi:catechol 2,3-dioxygenase-like lactoylglutathione lyase family enzyme
MSMKLEVVIIPVSDVDRAKAFYEKLGVRLDIDIVSENFRGIQFTPPNSEASIIFGKGVTSAKPGSADLVLAVGNVDAARQDLIVRGVNISELFHYAGGPFNNTLETAADDHHARLIIHSRAVSFFERLLLRPCNLDSVVFDAVIQCARPPRKFAAGIPCNIFPLIRCSRGFKFARWRDC